MTSAAENNSGHASEGERQTETGSSASESQRLLSLAAVLDGKTRAEAAKIVRMDAEGLSSIRNGGFSLIASCLDLVES
jgi:hypothetical protein